MAQQSKSRVVLEASKAAGFEITGHMDGLKEGEKVYAYVDTGNTSEQLVVTDSVYVKNGVFHMSGAIEQAPRKYYLYFEKHRHQNVTLLIDSNDHINIRSKNIDLIRHNYLLHYIDVEGSKTTRTFRYFWQMDPLYYQSIARIDNCIRQIKDSIGFDPSVTGGLLTAKHELTEALYYNYLRKVDTAYDSELAFPYLVLMEGYLGHSPLLYQIYKDASERARNSFYGRKLQGYAVMSIGQPFPGFSLPTPDGKLLTLQDVVSPAKLTLVHFWSTNSVDRLKYQDELRFLFKKYHDKGFNVVGISSDDSTSEYTYRKLLRQQPFPWPNVCDFQGKDGVVEKVYHEFGDEKVHNTTNVLLDDKGTIVAWDPIGAELQWYLWKYFDAEKDKHSN